MVDQQQCVDVVKLDMHLLLSIQEVQNLPGRAEKLDFGEKRGLSDGWELGDEYMGDSTGARHFGHTW